MSRCVVCGEKIRIWETAYVRGYRNKMEWHVHCDLKRELMEAQLRKLKNESLFKPKAKKEV